ncbi:MAG: hypothetical protein NTY33_00170 [Candidatus Moranbacteria bacterium]|nr:hypothetical protein [Candidatus Moranbacteria bacterium]
MKKQIVWLGALFAILTLAGCGNSVPQAADKTNSTDSAASGTQTESNTFSGSIMDLMAKGSNTQCTWSSGSDATKISGTVYVSGNKFFQEYSSVDARTNGEIKSYILNDGEWMYQWTSLSKMGTKMNTAEVKKLADDAQKANPVNTTDSQGIKEGEKLNDKFDYSCQKWNVDASKFALPSDIQFNDFSQMLNNLPKAATDGQTKIDVCQMCNNLPAEGKAACLANCQK